jgi:hypothetical protein
MNWSTDKIIAIGLLVVLIALVVCGGDKDVTSFLAGGLVGYLQRSHGGQSGESSAQK